VKARLADSRLDWLIVCSVGSDDNELQVCRRRTSPRPWRIDFGGGTWFWVNTGGWPCWKGKKAAHAGQEEIA